MALSADCFAVYSLSIVSAKVCRSNDLPVDLPPMMHVNAAEFGISRHLFEWKQLLGENLATLEHALECTLELQAHIVSAAAQQKWVLP